MDGEYKKALERIEILEKELSRIKQAIIALAEGQPAGEYMKFDTSAFLEENEIWSESYSALGGKRPECIRGGVRTEKILF